MSDLSRYKNNNKCDQQRRTEKQSRKGERERDRKWRQVASNKALNERTK